MPTLKQTLSEIKGDIPGGRFRIKTFCTNYLYSPRFRVLLNHRLGKYFFKSRFVLFRQVGAYYKMRLNTHRNCDISYNAKIGKNVKMPHPLGIVIGSKVQIKDNVMIFQQVTFGSHGKKNADKNYPVVESGVTIYAGAKIIGGITIGENAVIAANSVVNIDVPANSVAVGVPCKIILKQ